MKYLFVFIFILFMSCQAFSQLKDEKMLYVEKLEKYSRMKKTGKTLVLFGSVLSVAGIIILANSSTTTTYNGGYSSNTTTEGNPGAGLAAYLGGSICVGVGVPLWIVGGINKGKYERKLDGLTVGARVTPGGGGLSLRYRF
jgi:hypothetical protein